MKIIVCCDGTSNSEYIENNPPTNVSRIARSIVPIDNDGKRQVIYYHPGIGTDYRNPWNKYKQAVGQGLDQIILEAYSFICRNYSADVQDQIILIGFSRGAFAVRCIADLIRWVGVLQRQELYRVHEIYKTWKNGVLRNTDWNPLNPAIYPARYPARITACAVWDTVSSIGVPLPRRHLGHKEFKFVHSDVCTSIDNAFQALSLHEHRQHFYPIVWRNPQHENTRLEQCWFSGYHADAGGGNKKDALAHFALVWMISKLNTWVQFGDVGFQNFSVPGQSWTSSWIVGGDAGVRKVDNSYRLPVDDSMGPLYSAAGSRHRTPQTELWNDQGVHTPNHGHNVYKEETHATVRFLTCARVVKPWRSLASIDPYGGVMRWGWKLLPTAESKWQRVKKFIRVSAAPNQPAENIIYEETFSQFEKDVINAWLDHEWQVFDDMMHPPGEPEPHTLLVDLKAWLNNHTVNPQPLLVN